MTTALLIFAILYWLIGVPLLGLMLQAAGILFILLCVPIVGAVMLVDSLRAGRAGRRD